MFLNSSAPERRSFSVEIANLGWLAKPEKGQAGAWRSQNGERKTSRFACEAYINPISHIRLIVNNGRYETDETYVVTTSPKNEQRFTKYCNL
jgi:hypothetical protein